MNKRLMQFLCELAQENEELENNLKSERLHVDCLREQLIEQAAEIRKLKNQLKSAKLAQK